MWQIIKVLVLQIKISVPVTASPNFNSHFLCYTPNITGKMIKPVRVIPINWVWCNINSFTRQTVMSAVWILYLASLWLTKEIFILFFFCPVSA